MPDMKVISADEAKDAIQQMIDQGADEATIREVMSRVTIASGSVPEESSGAVHMLRGPQQLTDGAAPPEGLMSRTIRGMMHPSPGQQLAMDVLPVATGAIGNLASEGQAAFRLGRPVARAAKAVPGVAKAAGKAIADFPEQHPAATSAIGAGVGYAHGGPLGAIEGALGGGYLGRMIRLGKAGAADPAKEPGMPTTRAQQLEGLASPETGSAPPRSAVNPVPKTAPEDMMFQREPLGLGPELKTMNAPAAGAKTTATLLRAGYPVPKSGTFRTKADIDALAKGPTEPAMPSGMEVTGHEGVSGPPSAGLEVPPGKFDPITAKALKQGPRSRSRTSPVSEEGLTPGDAQAYREALGRGLPEDQARQYMYYQRAQRHELKSTGTIDPLAAEQMRNDLGL